MIEHDSTADGKGVPINIIHRAAFESSKDAILVSDREGLVLDYNAKFLELWGLTEEEMNTGERRSSLQIALDQLVDPDSFQQPVFQLRNFQDADTYDVHHFKDGRVVERYSHPLKLEGRFLGRIWTYHDITEKHAMQRELEYNLAILKAVIEQSPDGILIVNNDHKVVNFNALYLQTFKMDEDFLLNESAEKVIEYSVSQIKQKDKLRAEIHELMAHPDMKKFSLIEFLDGRIVERFTQVLSTDKENIGRALFYRDITESTNRITELFHRKYELDKFVYSASHELKAPLNSVMGLVNILRMEDLPESANHYLDLVDRSLTKLDTYIRNLAEYSQNENLEVRNVKVSFKGIVQECLNDPTIPDTGKAVDLKIDISEKVHFQSDPVRLKIILNNLIMNAYKYRNTKLENLSLEIAVHTDRDSAQITVSDNGIGIDLPVQEKIFDLFFRATTQSFGAGIGLYVTKKAVQTLGGQISCHSKLGEGSVFKVIIPNLTKQEKP